MKKIILLVFILISSVCFGQEKLVKFKTEHGSASVKAICLNGYLFAVALTDGMSGRSVSIAQIYGYTNSHTQTIPKPIKCKE